MRQPGRTTLVVRGYFSWWIIDAYRLSFTAAQILVGGEVTPVADLPI